MSQPIGNRPGCGSGPPLPRTRLTAGPGAGSAASPAGGAGSAAITSTAITGAATAGAATAGAARADRVARRPFRAA
jgi:hypothetical protein